LRERGERERVSERERGEREDERKRGKLETVTLILFSFFYSEAFVSTYMQFLAAKSLCTTFMLARYSIPLATWIHISISCLRTISTYSITMI
jgi:uncharacterized membrane protein